MEFNADQELLVKVIRQEQEKIASMCELLIGSKKLKKRNRRKSAIVTRNDLSTGWNPWTSRQKFPTHYSLPTTH